MQYTLKSTCFTASSDEKRTGAQQQKSASSSDEKMTGAPQQKSASSSDEKTTG